MFYVDGSDIYIHRGDSATLDIVFDPHTVVNSNGIIPEEYAVIDAIMVPALGAEVNGTMLDISVNRGSFPVFPPSTIVLKDIHGFVPEDGTPIRFSVKADTGRLKPVFQKDYEVYGGYVCIDFTPRDTWCLPPGEYVWDVRIYFPNVGFIEWNTPLNPCKFTVCEVVGNVI